MTLIKYKAHEDWSPFALARRLQDDIDRRFSQSFFDNERGFGDLMPSLDIAIQSPAREP